MANSEIQLRWPKNEKAFQKTQEKYLDKAFLVAEILYKFGQNQRQILNPVKHLRWSVLRKQQLFRVLNTALKIYNGNVWHTSFNNVFIQVKSL